MSDDEYRPGRFRPPGRKPLEDAINEQRWLDGVEDGIARWSQNVGRVSLEDWQKAMHNVKPRHVKIPRRRLLALKWSGWTFRHIWNHCPRYHADDD